MFDNPIDTTTTKPRKLPDPVEFATRTNSPQVSLREAVRKAIRKAILDQVLSDLDWVWLTEAMNYGDEELDVNVWSAFQYRLQSHQHLNVANELQIEAAQIVAELIAEAHAYQKKAEEAEAARDAEVRRQATQPARTRLAKLWEDPEFQVFMKARQKAGWARRRGSGGGEGPIGVAA